MFRAALLFPLLTVVTGCSDGEAPEDADESGPRVFVIDNFGDNSMEGHTPRGFQGQGNGLFAGDNLNSGFPDGDGVQLFLSFDLNALGDEDWQVESAELATDHGSASGTPYADLGALTASEIHFDAFSSALWDAEPVSGGASCTFADSSEGPFSCDLAAGVQAAIDDEREFAQFRLRFELAGDSDGSQDLATFFITDSNTDEPGIFTLAVTVRD